MNKNKNKNFYLPNQGPTRGISITMIKYYNKYNAE